MDMSEACMTTHVDMVPCCPVNLVSVYDVVYARKWLGGCVCIHPQLAEHLLTSSSVRERRRC